MLSARGYFDCCEWGYECKAYVSDKMMAFKVSRRHYRREACAGTLYDTLLNYFICWVGFNPTKSRQNHLRAGVLSTTAASYMSMMSQGYDYISLIEWRNSFFVYHWEIRPYQTSKWLHTLVRVPITAEPHLKTTVEIKPSEELTRLIGWPDVANQCPIVLELTCFELIPL